MTPQGLILFSGVQNPMGGTFTLAHGIAPSTAVLTVAPQSRPIPKIGVLTLSYGGQTVNFPDCILDRVEVRYDSNGRETWNLYIWDRRWKWRQSGRISGYYNVHRGGRPIDSENTRSFSYGILPHTQKSPRELARLCLEAMGERRYNIDRLPDDQRPEIEWDYDLPAEALARLCDMLGCRVVLGMDNVVRIEPVGRGNNLPLGYDVIEGGVSWDSPEVPDKLVLVTARIRWQMDLKLVAVGEERNGDIKPIDELSYTPAVNGKRTWEYADMPHYSSVSNLRCRELAKKSVYRWYRIKEGFGVPFAYPIETLDQILPIENNQIEMRRVEGRWEPRAPWVYGKFDPELNDAKVDPEIAVQKEPDFLNRPQGFYNRPFSVDAERGVVQFDDYVYSREKIDNVGGDAGATGGKVFPAEIHLRVAFSVRDLTTRGWVRGEFERRLGRSGTKPRYIVREDMPFDIVFRDMNAPTLENLDNSGAPPDLESVANYYLDTLQREYQWDTPATVGYAGFKAIQPDGAIQQVTWTVDENGAATTRASRNREEPVIAIPYEEQRMLAIMRERGVIVQETSQQQRNRQRMGRA
jgi:hypothetical protein